MNILISLILIVSLALTGFRIWLYEILVVKGWYGLNWLSKGSIYSSYLITLLVVFAFMLPFILYRHIAIRKFFFLTILFYLISVIYYEVAKQATCTFLFGRCSASIFHSNKFLGYLFIPSIFILPFFGRVYWSIVNKFIFKNKKSNRHIISTLVFLTIPFSLLTIQIDPGYGSGTDWIDAIKMGYPVFWITIFFGLSGVFIARQPELI